MKKNVGSIDKVVRFLIAAVLVVLYFTTSLKGGTLGIILLIVAGIMVLTSLISFCPLYTIFGCNSCKVKKG